MRTFDRCNVDSVLRDIDDEAKFARKLRDNYQLSPDERRKRLNVLNGQERGRAKVHAASNRRRAAMEETWRSLEAEAREEEGVEEP